AGPVSARGGPAPDVATRYSAGAGGGFLATALDRRHPSQLKPPGALGFFPGWALFGSVGTSTAFESAPGASPERSAEILNRDQCLVRYAALGSPSAGPGAPGRASARHNRRRSYHTLWSGPFHAAPSRTQWHLGTPGVYFAGTPLSLHPIQ